MPTLLEKPAPPARSREADAAWRQLWRILLTRTAERLNLQGTAHDETV